MSNGEAILFCAVILLYSFLLIEVLYHNFKLGMSLHCLVIGLIILSKVLDK